MPDSQKKYYHTYQQAEIKLRKQFKHQLIREQGFRCAYCGRFCLPSEFTLDHIVPISEGGATRLRNLVVCCKECNLKKGNKFIFECMDLIKTDIAIDKLLPKIKDYYYEEKNCYQKYKDKLEQKLLKES